MEAINNFRQAHGFLPLVVTSRTADYKALAEPLRLQGAILVQPLNREQVNAYLADLGSAGEPVARALQEDSSLEEVLDSPLMLFVVTVAYAGQASTPLPAHSPVTERRDHLLGSYVVKMLGRRAADKRYSPENTVCWLGWLAHQMANHGQTVFYLEQLQRDWLSQKQRWAIRVSTVLMSGAVTGVVGGLFAGVFSWLILGLLLALNGPVRILAAGLVLGLVIGGVVGLVTGLVSLSREIVCVETVRWSWSSCWRARSSILVVALVVGSVFGPFIVLLGSLTGELDEGVLFALFAGLFGGLLYGLFAGLFAGLIRGLTFSQIETRTLPNEGIYRSARNALTVGLICGLICGLVVVLVVVPFVELGDSLAGGLVVGLVFGLVGGLVGGGEACLKHVVLRLWLIHNGSTPWNYVRFLDYAAERILLRKVGGGYVFLHRMLLEYFAAQYAEPSAAGIPHHKPPAIADGS